MDARYRLGPMRDARARDEQTRRGELAGAAGDARALAAGVEAATHLVARARAALAAATGTRDRVLARGAPSTTGAALAQLEHYVRRLRRELEAAQGERLRAEDRTRGQLAVVDAARARLRLARTEREVIERHFAAWRTERRKLAERRED